MTSRATREQRRGAWAVVPEQRLDIPFTSTRKKSQQSTLASSSERPLLVASGVQSTRNHARQVLLRELIPLRLAKVQHLQHDVRPFPPPAAHTAVQGAVRRAYVERSTTPGVEPVRTRAAALEPDPAAAREHGLVRG